MKIEVIEIKQSAESLARRKESHPHITHSNVVFSDSGVMGVSAKSDDLKLVVERSKADVYLSQGWEIVRTFPDWQVADR